MFTNPVSNASSYGPNASSYGPSAYPSSAVSNKNQLWKYDDLNRIVSQTTSTGSQQIGYIGESNAIAFIKFMDHNGKNHSSFVATNGLYILCLQSTKFCKKSNQPSVIDCYRTIEIDDSGSLTFNNLDGSKQIKRPDGRVLQFSKTREFKGEYRPS